MTTPMPPETTPSNAASTAASKPAKPGQKPGMKRRWLFAILALTFLFILMPFLFWQATWFGRPLDDTQIAKSLADTEHPREIQHALSQIADRILATDAAAHDSARRFYPDIIRISQTGGDELRITAAWVMGQDNSVPEFHTELLRILNDSNPMARRNAALALIRFGDLSGRAEIRAILQPYALPSPRTGKINERLKPGEDINPGTLLGHVETPGQSTEIRSLVPGTIQKWLVPDGAPINAGDPIMSVAPSDAEVWEALRALYVVGEKEDLPAVDRISNGGTGAPLNVRKQAELTASAIRARG